jgi:NTP pyrophosphatase (non-canonical NTP hydrolase)
MNTFNLIIEWAHARNLIEGATRQGQMLKLTEEVGELAAAIARGKEDDVRDAIGDAVVVLTILAAQSGVTIERCITDAYDVIKNRTGKMVDGVFVRDL